MYEDQFEIIRQSQTDIRSLKHDMKHHLKMLPDLVSSGNDNAALKYLSDMGAFMDHTEKRIDSILNYMIAKAQHADIHISWKIQIPEQMEMTVDFSVSVFKIVAVMNRRLSFIHVLLPRRTRNMDMS